MTSTREMRLRKESTYRLRLLQRHPDLGGHEAMSGEMMAEEMTGLIEIGENRTGDDRRSACSPRWECRCGRRENQVDIDMKYSSRIQKDVPECGKN
jgi:hypothetical protein